MLQPAVPLSHILHEEAGDITSRALVDGIDNLMLVLIVLVANNSLDSIFCGGEGRCIDMLVDLVAILEKTAIRTQISEEILT